MSELLNNCQSYNTILYFVGLGLGSSRVNFKILVLTFRALHGQAPPYISDLIQPYTPARALRSVDQNLLMVPRTCFGTRGDRSFHAVAPRLWNDLPLSLCSVESVDSFKR